METVMKMNKEDIAKMSWADIQDVMKIFIKAGTWDKLVDMLGKPLHVIKYDCMVEDIRKASK